MKCLSRNEFVDRFETAARSLWCIAAAVLGGPDEADDVVQEAAMIAFTKRADFDPDTNFSAWAGQIVRNVARNSLRSRGRRTQQFRLVSHETTLDHHAESSTTDRASSAEHINVASDGRIMPDQRAFDDRVMEALQTLDETPRACLLLRVVHDLPYKDIAITLDIPQGTVMSHVHRARKTLVKHLQNDDGHSIGREAVS